MLHNSSVHSHNDFFGNTRMHYVVNPKHDRLHYVVNPKHDRLIGTILLFATKKAKRKADH